MQIAISSASLYPQYNTETAIINIAALGCRALEVYLQTRREYRINYVRSLGRICNQLGVNVLSLHAASSQFEPMLFYGYPRQVMDGMDTFNSVLEAASGLGAKCYVFHGPLRVDKHEYSHLLEGLHRVCETAANWGIRLAFENVSWGAGWSPELFKWLISKNVPNLYFTLDTKQAERVGFKAEEFIEAMAERLINVHISDGHGGVPENPMDFSNLVHKLKSSGYTGPIILEVYGSRVSSTSQLARGWRELKTQFQ